MFSYCMLFQGYTKAHRVARRQNLRPRLHALDARTGRTHQRVCHGCVHFLSLQFQSHELVLQGSDSEAVLQAVGDFLLLWFGSIAVGLLCGMLKIGRPHT